MIAPLVCFSDCKQAKQKTTQLFRSIVFGSRHLSDCCTMPPKVKSKSAALAIEAMASKPDKPSDVQQRKPEDDASPLPAVARKVKGAKTAKATSKANQAPMTKNKQGRPTFAKRLTKHIADECVVHEEIVQKVLDALEKLAAEALKQNGMYKLNFAVMKLRMKQARPEREKNVCGKVVTLKEKPATKVVKMHATKDFQQKVV